MDPNRPILHPIHSHRLSYLHVAPAGMLGCVGCGRKFLTGRPVFGCERCNVGLHKLCAKQPLVLIRHPLHPQHKLIMFVEYSRNKMVCKKCLLPFYGCLSYRCYLCDDFILHLYCAASTKSLPPQKDQGNRSSEMVSTFKHRFHNFTHHELILYDEVQEGMPLFHTECRWCEKRVSSGKFYACLPCQFFLHKACTFDVPETIRHPYTRKKCSLCSYATRPQPCVVCKGQIDDLIRWANDLHPRCTILSSSLKSEFHDAHNLTYLEKENYRGKFECSKCGQTGLTRDNHNGFYRCVGCDINFHLSCILPSTVEYKYHSCRNPLVLMNPIKDDFYCEYYCDICETKRHSDYCVYSCQDCNSFDAHIECALNQIRDEQPVEPALIIQSLKVESKSEAEVVIDEENQMRHHHHRHLLSLDDAVKVNRRHRDCRGCKERVFGQAFICRTCRDYCLHKECAKLSMSSDQSLDKSPLHPLHRLTLNNFEYKPGKKFICDACGEIKESNCFNYQCQECDFIMDLKCASLSEPMSQGFKKLEPSFHCGIHRHILFFGNYKNNDKRFYCSFCRHPVSGPTYCCLVCDFFLHEFCFRRFPSQLQLQIPSHSLHSFNITIEDKCNFRRFDRSRPKRKRKSCFACGFQFRGYDLCYSSDLDDLQLHPVCARTIAMTQPLVYDEAHNHALYYFGRDFQIMFRKFWQQGSPYVKRKWFQCYNCLEYCTRSFYRCLEDKRNFHLECVPIPQVVKSERLHRHCLKLKDSFDEGYDHDDQYCDVCEDKRDPKNHVYICEECVYPMIGHIKCVLFKTEETIQATRGASTKPASCNELDSDNSKIIRDHSEPLKFVMKKEFAQTFERGPLVWSVDLHPTKPWILFGLCKGNFCIWNYQSKEKEMSCTVPNVSGGFSTATAKFIAQKNWIFIEVYANFLRFISIYNYETSNFIYEFEAQAPAALFNGIRSTFMHPSQPYMLLFSDWDAVIRLWNWERGWGCMQEFIGHRKGESVHVAFNPRDYNTFASASKDGTILVWNFDSPDPVRRFRVRERLNQIEFFISGGELYLLTHQGQGHYPKVRDFKTKRCVQTLGGHREKVTTVCVHPEFPIIFTWSSHQIHIWNSANCRLHNIIEDIPELDFDIIAISCMKGSNYVALVGINKIVMVNITDSEDHIAINFQLDDAKEESNKGKERFGEEGSDKEFTESEDDEDVPYGEETSNGEDSYDEEGSNGEDSYGEEASNGEDSYGEEASNGEDSYDEEGSCGEDSYKDEEPSDYEGIHDQCSLEYDFSKTFNLMP